MSIEEQQEDRLQTECVAWFNNYYPTHRKMLFHVNNKAKNAIEGNKMKAMGVQRGVSDLVLILPKSGVIWIEMKTATGYQSTDQKDFQVKVEDRGHTYVIKRTLSDFKILIESLLGKSTIKPLF